MQSEKPIKLVEFISCHVIVTAFTLEYIRSGLVAGELFNIPASVSDWGDMSRCNPSKFLRDLSRLWTNNIVDKITTLHDTFFI